MVFFTCNNCGDSLKKKDCANHAGRCRPLALTCVDCHKDFFGDEFVAHTSCVTEAEKYGVKGFVSRAPSNAGAAKQEEWTHALLAASESSGLTSSQKFFLGILSRHGNVPRKKKQFENFARNVWRDCTRQPGVVDQVFGLIEIELLKIKGPPKENIISKAETESNEERKDNAINSAVDVRSKVDKINNKEAIDALNGEQENTSQSFGKDIASIAKKSKKKSKKDTQLNENESELIPGDSVSDTASKKSKKKKHRKQKVEAEEEEEVTQNGNGIIDESVVEEDDSMKSLNKKRKRKETGVEAETVINVNVITEEPATAEDSSNSSKKRKSKKKPVAVDENGTVEMAEDLSTKKKSKKKNRGENGAEATGCLNGKEEITVDVEKETSKKSKKKPVAVDENGTVEMVDDFATKKKSKEKNHKENGADVTGREETDIEKETSKKSKKKKRKLQEAEEHMAGKKYKSASG